jgi:small GTP-binding protein
MTGDLSPKLVMVGGTSVGKSSLVRRFTTGLFNSEEVSTIGATTWRKVFVVHGQEVNLAIWDTAGMETFRTLTPIYYRGASLAIVMFSVDLQPSFTDVDWWIHSIKDECPEALIVLVGNKVDKGRVIESEAGEAKAREYGIDYHETSALTGQGVTEVFEAIVSLYLDAELNRAIIPAESDPVNLNARVQQEPVSSCC